MKLFLLGTLILSTQLFAAPPFVYQATAVKALMDDYSVFNQIKKMGVLEEIRLLPNLMFDLVGSYNENGRVFRCHLMVEMKTDRNAWNPKYTVANVGKENCLEAP